MSLPDLRKVRQSFRKHLLDELGTDFPEALYSAENRAFTPPPIVPPVAWIRETLQVASEGMPALELVHTIGRMVFDVMYPKDKGTEVPEDVEVRVWDSTAELRYIVLPERPAGTENMSEEELAALVTRNSMVGVTKL